MRILVAFDKLKHALSAEAACRAVADGIRRAAPDADLRLRPLGDGGEGTGAVLADALGAAASSAVVQDPLGRSRAATWWFAARQRLSIVESAQAAGLALLASSERDPLRASTYGVGELVSAAAAKPCEQVLLGVGGTATVDGGAGCLQALGWRLLTHDGAALARPVGGGDLEHVSTIEPPARLPPAPLRVLCDVDNPLLGPSGAAAVYAPQKGAGAEAVARLERGLRNWARVLARTTGRDVADRPGAGAGGGLAAGLAAGLDAALYRGGDEVAELAGLATLVRDCDLCLTGEGRLDAQTLRGKVVAAVARTARAARVPCVALVGEVRPPPGLDTPELTARLGLREIVVITPAGCTPAAALAGAADNLRCAAARLMERLTAGDQTAQREQTGC
ncbi:MAG: glycerate kinase [Phycisphaerae bacterium]|nr:glycerate kinase [Phycisphaerae bacterium]MCZ2401178.1 glycerate kinase [Phycisphaerae bacterium]